MVLAIRGLDATVETYEVAGAPREAGVHDQVTINLGELKDGWTGRRTAMVRLPQPQGQRLLQRGVLVVGWAKCRAKVTLFGQETCCFNCQKFGHIARDCTEPANAQKKCYRCGSGDHIAKDAAHR
ncbi:uncharacterized protein LOC108865283 [Galendromus occidentalis]|uniref:Uncharacterized protein LOC108865283 n=1 Tax=Galendromus occidentalis TaxID=34638 RepID=A0AAJ7L6X4_9ACAR|nr:uncharacterized protein LOC108865283 [Galendromus occidentalis]